MKNVIKKFSRELEVVAALAVIMVVFGVIQPIYFWSGACERNPCG